MDPIISRLLDELPDKPSRSKLEPHADVIAALRRKRRTYREIAEFFREHLARHHCFAQYDPRLVRVRRGRRKQKIGSAQEGVPSDPEPARPFDGDCRDSRPAKFWKVDA